MQQKIETVKMQEKYDRAFFMDPRHKMVVGTVKVDPLYEQAFLSREDKSKTEYAQNTTAWD